MTELAAGAVSSLLLVVRNEQRLLGSVKDDVQFIKEEMESMKSFLAHLAQSTPSGREHDEQVRTWMNQVRLLAQDCHNCIELYVYSGNPDIHRAKGRLRRYLWWVYWFLRKLLAQHRAAVQLRQLKDRARDVGERRLRYGVEVPSKSAVGQSASVAMVTSAASSSAVAGGYAAGDDEDDGDDDQLVVGARATSTDHSTQTRALFSRSLDDYVKAKILEWRNLTPRDAGETMSFVMVAPDKDRDINHIITLVRETLFFQDLGFEYKSGYHLAVLIDIPALHMKFRPLETKEVLFYILSQLKLELQSQSRGGSTGGAGGAPASPTAAASMEIGVGEEEEDVKKRRKMEEEREEEIGPPYISSLDPPLSQYKSQTQKEGTDQVEGEKEGRQLYNKNSRIYCEKETVLNKIKEKIQKMKIYEKLDEIKSSLKTQQRKRKHEDMAEKDPNVHVLLQQLLRSYVAASQQDQLMKNKDLPTSAWDDNIEAVADKLREYMEMEVVEVGVQNVVREKDHEGGQQKVEVREEDHEGGQQKVEECGGGKETVEKAGGGPSDTDEGDGRYEDEQNGGGREEERKIYLHKDQYGHILRQVFPKATSSSSRSSDMQATNTILGEDQIKQMIYESKQEILRELQEGKDNKIQETRDRTKRVKTRSRKNKIQETRQNTEATFTDIVDQKMDKIKQEFEEQLIIKALVDEIKYQLKKNCPLFILKIDKTVYLTRWEDTRNALSLLGCSADVLIVTTAKDIQKAKEYCYPQKCDLIEYSLVGLYYDTVLKITKDQNEENYDPKIFRNILEQCEPYESCMKIFAHALYVNPKRSNEELNKLHKNLLKASPKSSDIIAKKMFKFSYTDMPKEYKSCLLYLAIYLPGHKIRRSTLIGRWVAEGLIFEEDWPSSVRRANRCFDELINRCLVDPAETGAAGKIKSCVVGAQVHGFITKIARKQHMVETRLSHQLARHFSIFNDLHLRISDKIDGFFHSLSKSSRVSLIKVLDLEGCHCFGEKNQHYLEDICTKMLLLKYLSLRGTDVTQLPSKINNLRELEVLDIRQTNVPMNAIANVLLLKLKRLLAGNTDRSPRPTLRAEELVSTAIQIPHKIEKMVNMEALSNVKARSSRDLKDIGKLWQLRKLGVVVDDDSSCLKNLLRAISDLRECLCSLSITLPTATSKATPSSQELPKVSLKLKHQPKLLESLSISGTTRKGYLLPLFIKDINNNLLNKLTLSCTSLNQNNLDVLAKLPKLQSIRLRHIAFTDIESLVFKKKEFKYLKYLLVEGSSFTKISFEDEAACMLEKMALSYTNIESVSGVYSLQKLEEVELSMSRGNKKNDTLLSSFNNGKQTMAKLTIASTSLEQGDQETQNMITFNEGEFRKLKLLIVDCSATTEVVFSSGSARKLEKIVCSSSASAITKVVFTSGSAPQLEKIVWSSSTSLSGINYLSKLMELEFNGDPIPDVVKEAIENHKNKVKLNHNKPEIQNQSKEDEQEDDDDDAARFSLFCCKK